MASSIYESVGERKEQWRKLERYWRDGLEEALVTGQQGILEICTLDGLEAELDNYRVRVVENGDERLIPVMEKVHPATKDLTSLRKVVYSASQHEPAAGLIWAGLAAVIHGASDADIVTDTTVNIINKLGRLFSGFGHDNGEAYSFIGVQYALQDLFEHYMRYCAEASSFFRQRRQTPTTRMPFARSAEGLLEDTRSRISRELRRFRDAAASELKFRRAQQEAEIANMIPAGISDLPQDAEIAPTESGAEFPVHTVDRARNNAFVGRQDILDEIAGKFVAGMNCTHDRESTFSTSSPCNHGARPRETRPSETATEIDAATYQEKHLQDGGPSESCSVTTSSLSKSKARTTPKTCVLHGIGGVGKTQVTLEYYYEHRDEYDACFWFEAEHDWTLAASFARIADKLNLLSHKTTDEGGHEVQNKAIEVGRNWLQTTKHSWLLLFDNVEDFQDLARYMPNETRSNSAIIITTQSPSIPAWLGNVSMVQVEALDAETAASCIFRYLERDADDQDEYELACQLAEHVGCLPLAMATIGGYVKQTKMSLEEFFENVKHKAKLWERAPRINETHAYERSLVSVFSKAFEELRPAARELLNVLAFLDPDSIPEDIFMLAIEKDKFRHIHNRDDFLDCYFELRARHLIKRDTSSKGNYISIHRTVQWNVLLDLSGNYELRWACFKQAFDIIQTMLPKTSPLTIPEPEVWPPYARHGRQILELRTHCLWPEPPVQLPWDFAQILSDMGSYMWFSGKFPEGEKALETAENILDDNKAARNDPLRANIYLLLGIITSFEGVSERQRSMNFRKHGLQARNEGIGQKPEERLTREEDILLWNAHSDMAFGFIQEEDFGETQKYMEECKEHYLTWDKLTWDKDDPITSIPYEYAKYYQLVSHCHMAEQKPTDSIRAITKCLRLMQKAAGNEHPMSQLIKFCQATLLWHTGFDSHRKEALDIHKAVLEFRRKLLGEFSHFTLESYSTCGKLYHEAGKLEEARQCLATCLQRRKRAVWNEEGITRAQFRYSMVLSALAEQARIDGAEEKAKLLSEDADERQREVRKVIDRYRREYKKYMPRSEHASEEENLDQMVSFWAGRFTGRMRQQCLDMSGMDVDDEDLHRSKRRKRE